ncbi:MULTISPECIES: hypothetical protein [Rhizobium]|uniref:Uncharacterized protein n=1 Tax=Rhizobium favelukesii TaxID=348824 RepID=W6RKK0_9HYPH|nr:MULTISPECIES: hypothetical protein [Rhizobium]MCA0804665.1 hypothetical protein [Rhizobium sp. T1473]MCS0457939.1 hypothetical protein [Rhizobium favelukesii]UFS79958.1 hypothetical protein LPB79_01135 [Rhizobium sp. T136]CDM61667.1 hypothetical protein LPU83_pLPU83d_0296 [Rhizobium favelukesii]
MQEPGKTLDEMTLRERSDIMSLVAEALEETAGQAREIGDIKYAANSTCLAKTIRGLASDLSPLELKAATILLEQGISLVASFEDRARSESSLH